MTCSCSVPRLAQGPEDDGGTIEARKNVYYLDHVCSSSKSFSQKFNYSSKRGQVDPTLLARTRVEDGDDEQRDVATFLQIVTLISQLIVSSFPNYFIN